MGMISKWLLGPITDSVTDVVKTYITKKADTEEVRAKVKEKVAETLGVVTKENASVIKAEVGNGNFLTRSWRPITAIYLFALWSLQTCIFPWAHYLFGTPAVPMNAEVYVIFTGVCLTFAGGYAGLRSIEKLIGKTFGGK